MNPWHWLKASKLRWIVFVVALALFLIWLTHFTGLDLFEAWF